MAGTVPNLPLSMQFDKDTGKPLRGGKLSFYQANTTTPQLAYKDVGLTLPHPNPITLDGAGRVPSFYLADGLVRVRLTNARGSVQFDGPPGQLRPPFRERHGAHRSGETALLGCGHPARGGA